MIVVDSDAEVLQEICHRYTAIDRREMIQPAFDVTLEIVDEVFAIDQEDAELGKDYALRYRELSARDALHLPVLRRHDVERILTFDRGFDGHAGLERVS